MLTVVSSAIVTGAFHEDGLADVCDGLGPHTREDALRVMRDSRIGTFGGVGLWMLLTLIKHRAVASLPPSHLWAARGRRAHAGALVVAAPVNGGPLRARSQGLQRRGSRRS